MAHVKKAKHTLISCTRGSLTTVFKFVSTAVLVGLSTSLPRPFPGAHSRWGKGAGNEVVGLWGGGGVRRGLVYEHFDVL